MKLYEGACLGFFNKHSNNCKICKFREECKFIGRSKDLLEEIKLTIKDSPKQINKCINKIRKKRNANFHQ